MGIDRSSERGMAPPESETTLIGPHVRGIGRQVLKKRGCREAFEGVSEAIVPLMRVTTAEERASGNFNLERETFMVQTKTVNKTETKLKRIAQLSRENPGTDYIGLMPHVNKESLTRCFHELKGNKAVGIDQMTKEEYGKNLDKNIENLVLRMKSMTYYPSPVRETLIPKDDGKFRPLGISNLEDKIVQRMFAKILGAIYEPLFQDCSFGFRPRIGCHDAIKQCSDHLFYSRTNHILDLDLQNYFGTIDHKKLVTLLRMKIKDERFIRYSLIRKQLHIKAVILSIGNFLRSSRIILGTHYILKAGVWQFPHKFD